MDSPPPSLNEQAHRRPDWTGGVPVTLADGDTWHFPVIDLALLVATPPLRMALARAAQLARLVPTSGKDARGEILMMSLYHAHLAQVALRLLRINYDLPDGRWTALTEFKGVAGMLGMTLRASDVAATAFEVGRAILGPADRGWPDGGSLN